MKRRNKLILEIIQGLLIFSLITITSYYLCRKAYRDGYSQGEKDTWVKVYNILQDKLRDTEEDEDEGETLEGITTHTKYKYHVKRNIR